MPLKNELAKVVGNENVLVDPKSISHYSRDESFVGGKNPRYIVTPKNRDEVQALVRLANETLTPLIPISSGPPHFKGDTVPGIEGTVVVNLSKMKKILRVDQRNKVAMIEPGVTFGELELELEKQGMRLNMPLLPRSSKSVIGSMLEREPVIMPKYHWDISDPIGSMEVIFGSGDVFRTGSAAGVGTLEEQWKLGAAQISPLGPAQADWHRIIQGAQGTMGIVTWAAVRCERLPRLEEPFLVGSAELDKLFELTHWLIRRRLVNECLVLNATNVANILAKGSFKQYKELRDSLPQWILFFCIAGYESLPEERVAYQTQEMMDIALKVGVKPTKTINKITSKRILNLLRRPSEEPFWKLRRKGSCHDIFFLTTYNKIPEFIKTINDEASKHNYPSLDVGVYLQPIVQGTSCHCEFNLFFDPKNTEEVATVQSLSMDAARAVMTKGAFFSRPYGPWADMVYCLDSTTVNTLRLVKGIIDPHNVMNPGKLCFQSEMK